MAGSAGAELATDPFGIAAQIKDSNDFCMVCVFPVEDRVMKFWNQGPEQPVSIRMDAVKYLQAVHHCTGIC